MRGFSAAVTGQMPGMFGPAGDTASRTFGDRFSAGVRSVVSSVGQTITSGLIAAGAVGGAFLTKSLIGGTRRLTALEDADKMLDQMGVSSEDAEKLMGSLLDTLLGTPFALDTGAKSMANLVSAGLPLDKIPGLIDQITDAAAFGQAPLDQVALIWQRIALEGRATNEELNMLTTRNIPVYSLLASAMGISEEAVRDLAAAGELTADKFFTAWDTGAQGFGDQSIVMAGAAKSMGDTTRGAFANMTTAIDRFGANTLEPLFPLASTAFGGINEALTVLGDRVVPVMQRIADSPGFARLEQFFTDMPALIGPFIDRVSDGMSLLGPALAPLLAFVGAAGLGGLSTMLGPLGALVPTINPIVAGIAALVAVSPELRTLFADVLVEAAEALAPALPAVADALAAVADALADVVAAILPALPPLAEMAALFISGVAAPVIIAVAGAVGFLADKLAPFAEIIGPAVAGLWAFKGALDFGRTVAVAIQGIGMVIVAFAQMVAAAVAATARIVAQIAIQIARWTVLGIQALVHAAKVALAWVISMGPIGLVVAAVAGATALIIANWDKIQRFVTTAAKAVVDFLKRNWPLIVAIIGGPIGAVVALVIKNWDTIKSTTSRVWNSIIDFFKAIPGRVTGAIHAMISGVGGIARDAWAKFREVSGWMVSGIIDFVRNIPGRVIAAIGNIVVLLGSKAREAWNSFSDATSGAVEGVIGFVGGIPGRILGALGDVGSLLYNAGRQIINGLLAGIKDAFGSVTDFVGGIGGKIIDLKGPLPEDKKMLIPAGVEIMGGLQRGLRSQLPELEATLAGVTDAIRAAAPPQANRNGMQPMVAEANGDGRREVVHIDNAEFNDPVDLDALFGRANAALRLI